MRFDEFDFNYDVLDALDAMHFEECTPIQERAIPAALDGRDLIAVAQTAQARLPHIFSWCSIVLQTESFPPTQSTAS